MADVFAELRKEKGGLWNRESKEAQNAIEGKGKALSTKNFIYVDSDLKEIYKKYSSEEQFAQKEAFSSLLGDIKRNLSLGKTPKREDFVQAAKRIEDIIQVLGDATGKTTLDPELIGILNTSATEALGVLGTHTPGKISAGTKAIGTKMKSVTGGFLKGMISEMTAGIPFAPELMEIAGSKIKGAFGGVTGEQKEMASMLEGVGDAKTNGGVSTGPTAGMKGLGNIKDMTGQAQSFFNKALGGGEEAESVIATAGGTVATNGNGGGLTETNEILKDILEAVKPDAEAGREAERERELERLEDQKKDIVTRKPEDGKGLFGGLFKGFKFGELFKKGGIARLISTLGGSLLGGATTAVGSTGVIGKQLATSAKWGQLGKGAGVGLLVTGLAVALADGMEGYANKEKWGVGGFSAAFGGALGGADKGISGALKGAGKFALIGAGLGSIFPVVGTVIGGAIGALLGAVLGFFGGEKIAKAISDLGKWVASHTNNILKSLGLKEKTKEDHLVDIETDRKILENKMKSAEEAGVGEGQRFSSAKQKSAFITGLKKDEENLRIREESAHAGVGNLDTGERVDKLENLKASLSGAEEDAAAAPAKITMYKQELEARIEKWGKTAPMIQGSGPGSIFHTNEMIKRAEASINKPQKIRNQITKLESLYTGGRIATSGIATVHAGEEVLEAAEVSRIERALAGAVMNQQMMERMMGRGARPTQSPTIIDASTVQNVSNNTLIRPPSPGGQLMAGERRDFVSIHKIA